MTMLHYTSNFCQAVRFSKIKTLNITFISLLYLRSFELSEVYFELFAASAAALNVVTSTAPKAGVLYIGVVLP